MNNFLSYLLDASKQSLPIKTALNLVVADIQMRQPEPLLHAVVVAHLLNVVGLQTEPEEGLGHVRVVEPLEAVVGGVEPLQVVRGGQQAVQVRQQVAVQAQRLQ